MGPARFRFFRACAVLAAAIGLPAGCALRHPTGPPKPDASPNIVIIFADDQGYGDLSCYGHPTIHTPHIDRMAAEGMKLTQFYVASPVCSPSRAALLTGCYPKRVGMHRHVVFPPDDWGLHTDEVTIADLLRERGYATACIGKWHLGHRRGLLPTDQGFDEFFGVPYSNDMSRFHRSESDTYPHALPLMRADTVLEWEPDQHELTRRYTEEAVNFIDRHHGEPFFLYLPHSMPHIPIYASEAFAGRSPRGLYGDVIEEIDWSVGEIRAALERHGLSERTLVVFTSDNGPWLPFKTRGGTAGPLRGGKGSNWEGGQRVPCVVWWPGRVPAGSISRAVTTTMDLLPTIARLTGAPLADRRRIDGHDISALLSGEGGATSPTEAFIYYTSNGEPAGIRRGPWKLLLEAGELYDVEADIGEKWDRAQEHPELVAELRVLAEARDAEITATARPRMSVLEPLFKAGP
ncbi:MAG: arylsulfatase [Planctomycetes bacterium]|nr:arylsulfatase [Planctomycetota bacterium]